MLYCPGLAPGNRRYALAAAQLALVAAGCKDRPVPPRETFSAAKLVEAIGSAHRLAAGDLDGDRRPELVVVDAEGIRVVDLGGRELARAPAPGGIQVLRVADVDGDGRAEILAGWGRSREHQRARGRVALYRLQGGALVEEVVVEPPSTRHDIVAILPVPGERPPQLVLSHYESKYMVRLVRARRSGGDWEITPIDTIRMATSLALGDVDGDGRLDLIVGRVYGDELEADGDAFVLRPDGSREPIPVSGGVRSLALVDLDGDGGLEILIGDGWNRSYARRARGRLVRAWWSPGGFGAELVAESAGDFTLWDILTPDLDGDGRPEIVTRGNQSVRILERDGHRWRDAAVASSCHDVVAVELDGRPGEELLGLCEDGPRILGRPGDGAGAPAETPAP
jgi:hypothetical protein